MPTPSDPPRALFVIPCYNHGAFVGEAVASALAQCDTDARVVVIDDGSDDGVTPAACDACRERAPERVRVIHQANAGLPAARNAGMRACADDDHGWFVFLDADDTLDPGFTGALHRAIEDAEAQDAGGAPVSHAYCFERVIVPGSEAFVWRTPAWDADLLMLTNLHPVTALVRREAVERVGLFDASFREGYEDWELWIRLALAGWRGVRVREALFHWRRHGEGTSLVESAVRRHDELYARIIDRHRSAYAERAERLLKLWNHIARGGDSNWLDETLRPIAPQGLERHIERLEGWLREAQGAYAAEQASHAETRRRLEAALAETERLRSLRGAARTMAERVRARLGFR